MYGGQRFKRCPLLGGSKCISAMLNSFGAAACPLFRGRSLFGGSVNRGFTVANTSLNLTTLVEMSSFQRWVVKKNVKY